MHLSRIDLLFAEKEEQPEALRLPPDRHRGADLDDRGHLPNRRVQDVQAQTGNTDRQLLPVHQRSKVLLQHPDPDPARIQHDHLRRHNLLPMEQLQC